MPNNEFGDFQTPRALAAQALDTLLNRPWARILEPTCGTGTFLHQAVKRAQDAQTVGIEVQPEYVEEARMTSAQVIERDIFTMDLGKDVPWISDGPLLVVGNPPWVTNTQLSTLDSRNRPERVNLKNLSGYEAMTGSSNFDIAEYIWLKLITELQHNHPTISLLCKTQVARNVLEYCAKFNLPISAASVRAIDAKKWFNAAVDACLFTVDVNAGPVSYVCDLYDSIDSTEPSRRFGIVDGRFVADVDAYDQGRRVDGKCPIEWRQGMKHDAAAVMELVDQGGPTTRAGVPVDLEDAYLYPLLKCTDVFRNRLGLSKWVIVPQISLGDDTRQLANSAPKLWSYLNANASVLDGRKSSIYRNRPRFSVFGLGAYSFKPYKIAISGLHKSAEFRLVGPVAGKPVFFDDTCYLLPFDDANEAAVVAALLKTEAVSDFFRSLTFWDAKRPVTKKLLQRIDLLAVANIASETDVVDAARKLLAELEIAETKNSIPSTFIRLKKEWSGELAAAGGPALQSDRLF